MILFHIVDLSPLCISYHRSTEQRLGESCGSLLLLIINLVSVKLCFMSWLVWWWLVSNLPRKASADPGEVGILEGRIMLVNNNNNNNDDDDMQVVGLWKRCGDDSHQIRVSIVRKSEHVLRCLQGRLTRVRVTMPCSVAGITLPGVLWCYSNTLARWLDLMDAE